MRSGNTAKLKLVSAMLIFGTIGIFVRHIRLSSSVIALARALIGAGVLAAVMAVKSSRPSAESIRRNIVPLSISGAFIGLNWIFLFEAYRYTTVAAATVCYYLAPVIVILVSPFVLKERLSMKGILCAAAAMTGMVFVSGAAEGGMPDISEIKGILYGVGAAALYAAVILINKRSIKDIGAFDTTLVQLSAAGAVTLPYVLLTEDMSGAVISAETLILLLTVGVVHTGLAYAMYFSSLNEVDAQSAAILSYIDPASAIVLSAVILHEMPDAGCIIGAVLILGSAFISEMPLKKASDS